MPCFACKERHVVINYYCSLKDSKYQFGEHAITFKINYWIIERFLYGGIDIHEQRHIGKRQIMSLKAKPHSLSQTFIHSQRKVKAVIKSYHKDLPSNPCHIKTINFLVP